MAYLLPTSSPTPPLDSLFRLGNDLRMARRCRASLQPNLSLTPSVRLQVTSVLCLHFFLPCLVTCIAFRRFLRKWNLGEFLRLPAPEAWLAGRSCSTLDSRLKSFSGLHGSSLKRDILTENFKGLALDSFST